MAKKQPGRQRTVAEITAAARLRERTVTLAFAGDLQDQVEQLQQELADASSWTSTSLADVHPAQELSRQIESLREEMTENEATFRFRALPARQFSDLLAQHAAPGGTGALFDVNTFPPALIARCCVDPAMTVDEYAELAEVLSHAQQEVLFDAAWTVNQQVPSVPFSLMSSAILASLTAEK